MKNCIHPKLILNPALPDLAIRFNEFHYPNGIHPSLGKSSLDFPYNFYRSLMAQCDNPDDYYFTDGNIHYPLFIEVGCGECALCKESRRIDLVQRMQFEQCLYDVPPIFVTLTYNEENVWRGLNKKELQNFLKRLRHHTPPIRYFACGEFGSKTHRPHFHLIIFGLPWNECEDLFNQSWPFGFTYAVKVCDNDNRFKYVAKYCTKQDSNDGAFQLWSKGLGSSYCRTIFTRINLECFNLPDLTFMDYFGNLQNVVINHWFLDVIFGSYAKVTYPLRSNLKLLYKFLGLKGFSRLDIPECLRRVHAGVDWSVKPKALSDSDFNDLFGIIPDRQILFNQLIATCYHQFYMLNWQYLDQQRVNRANFVSKFNLDIDTDYLLFRNSYLLSNATIRESSYIL